MFISIFTFSQSDYDEIADSTKKWNTVNFAAGTIINKIGGEVIIYDSIFSNVFETRDSLQQEWDHVGYLREDTVGKKIYFSKWGEEIGLIYDFDIEVGDSVIIDNYYVGFEDVIMFCDSINSVIINGVSRNQLFFSSPNKGWIADIWIEGIGSRLGLLNSGLGGAGYAGGGDELLCCSKNDTIIYMDTVYNSCYINEFYPKFAAEHYDTAYLNENYEFQLQLVGTDYVDSFTLIGDVIPNDFELNVETGLLTGLPETTGTFPCIITLRNNDIGFLTDMLYSEIIVVLPTKIIDKPTQSEIKIHPNPFCNSFFISYDGNLTDSYYLEIFNCDGKMLDKKTITANSFEVDFSNYQTGIYLLRIIDINQRILKTEKIINQ
jgi:hypothetical protein